MEEALFLTRFASEVTVIHRRDKLRASKIMAERAERNPKIRFAWNSSVTEIFGKDDVDGIRMKDVATGEERTLACKGVFVALGHVPNTKAFAGQLNMDESGYIELQYLVHFGGRRVRRGRLCGQALPSGNYRRRNGGARRDRRRTLA